MSQSIYEIRIKDGGKIDTTLIEEGVSQSVACNQILNLTHSLGAQTSHDERTDTPQPVNIGLNLPGTN